MQYIFSLKCLMLKCQDLLPLEPLQHIVQFLAAFLQILLSLL